MRNCSSLFGMLLGTALLLASCGTSTVPASGGAAGYNSGGGAAVTGQPVSGTVAALVYRAVALGTGISSSAEIRITGSAAKTAAATIKALPAGLSVTPGEAVALTNGEISIPLTVTGSAQSGTLISVTVTVAGKTAAVEVPVLTFGAQAITGEGGLSSPYPAANLRFQPDGTLLLSGGLGGNSVDRRNLVKYDPATKTFSLIPMGVTYSSEAITSFTTAPDGALWATVRGITAKGSYVVSRAASGNLKTYFPDAAGDNLFNLATASDGRIWFTQYTRAAIKALTPGTGSVESYPVSEQADSLIRGADGKLYYAAFYARPAIVQLDPGTGQSKSFDVGSANRSLPLALSAAPDGSIWFIEARSGTVWQLDPSTGTQTQFALPSDARPNAIAVTAAGKIWVSDATNAALYTTFTASSGKSVLTAYRAVAGGGPSALTPGPDGKVWYVSAGQLVTQQ